MGRPFHMGVQMLTWERLAWIALAYDTSMALAMRRALGIAAGRPARARRRGAGARRTGCEYDGMLECFRNRRGVDPEAGM